MFVCLLGQEEEEQSDRKRGSSCINPECSKRVQLLEEQIQAQSFNSNIEEENLRDQVCELKSQLEVCLIEWKERRGGGEDTKEINRSVRREWRD